MASTRTVWERVLRADEANQAYFATRAVLPGVTLFRAERADAPEFDFALIYRVLANEADATLRAIASYFQALGRGPRVRLSSLSTPRDWPARLRWAGYAETDDGFNYFSVPASVALTANPDVHIWSATSLEDGDVYSAIQVVGFDIPPEHREWDRELARRHLAAGKYTFYLASLRGRPVGAARSIHVSDGMTAMAALATLPEARGHGVGTSLLARMVDDGRAAGSRLVFGAVIPDSYAAAMYGRLGFVHLFETRTFAKTV